MTGAIDYEVVDSELTNTKAKVATVRANGHTYGIVRIVCKANGHVVFAASRDDSKCSLPQTYRTLEELKRSYPSLAMTLDKVFVDA